MYRRTTLYSVWVWLKFTISNEFCEVLRPCCPCPRHLHFSFSLFHSEGKSSPRSPRLPPRSPPKAGGDSCALHSAGASCYPWCFLRVGHQKGTALQELYIWNDLDDISHSEARWTVSSLKFQKKKCFEFSRIQRILGATSAEVCNIQWCLEQRMSCPFDRYFESTFHVLQSIPKSGAISILILLRSGMKCWHPGAAATSGRCNRRGAAGE